MKRFFHNLSSWWMLTMAPMHGSLNTIDARETWRKRRLLSLLLATTLFLLVSLLLLNSINGFGGSTQVIQGAGICGVMLLAFWINRRGDLKSAGLLYVLALFFYFVIAIWNASLSLPSSMLCTWCFFLIIPTAAALFLPPWAPIILTLCADGFSYWFLLTQVHNQLAVFIPEPGYQYGFYTIIFIITLTIAIISTVWTITSRKAIMQTDRADELEMAHQQLDTAYKRMEVSHHHLEEAHATIQKQAFTDGLTGLLNHGAIVKQIESELQQCQNSERTCAIIFIDVDHFKRINDTWGHAAGDAALHAVGQRLRAGIREHDSVGRYGGEEFVILLPNTKQSEALDVAGRLRCALAEAPCLWLQEEKQATISIPLSACFGLAAYPLNGLATSTLLETADAAMYRAKHTGRNRVCLPDEDQLTQDQNQHLPQYSEQNVLQTLSTMATFHDQETQEHAHRMIHLAEATMRVLDRSENETALLRLAAQLHDIGKIGIPEAIVQKPGPLTEEEWDIMRRHPQISQQILAQAKGHFGLVSHIVVAHHERWDGQGYPYGLSQQQIPLGARLLSVIDSYDAMTSSRPYREALSATEAQAELLHVAGSQLDPHMVDAFLQVLQAQSMIHNR